MLTAAIRSKIDALWDKFWSGGIANPLTAMEQISYLLFMRRLDATDRKREEDAEWLKKSYSSAFHGTYTALDGKKYNKAELRWSHFRHLPGEEMLAHVRDRVFPFIKSLGGNDEPFSQYMHDAVFIIPKASLLVEAIGIIDDIYNEIERERLDNGQTFHDTQGDLYEHLLSEISTAGKNGQFRTPRHIIQMICALVDPRLGEEICDPACGTGGFLLGAYQHILTHHTSPKLRQIDENGMERGLVGDRLTDERQWKVLREKSFYGYDFDTTMVRIGLMNLLLHGIDHPNLGYMDTLSKKYDEKDRYNVVLANPPFKGSIDKGDINEDLKLKTTKTELLFVNRMINLLCIGGTAGVIVPDGVLFGSSKAHQDLRKMLIEKCELQAVVSMPSGVFKPYAGVSTAALVFVKGGETEHVWFYDMEADGYSLDDKREKIEENDVPDTISRWKKRNPKKDTDRKAKAFFVPAQEIRDNKYDLSINRYKEIEYEEVEYEPPKVILRKLRRLEDEIRADLDGLEEMLG
ncbi:MAG: class I SAM-dependent DNA methyltransferase [Thermodesulfobacteriota bacterium]|nr:class I SAM-dependent DNA methyltransferase [Thermodesulfobacteriota bacterium]